MVKLAVTGSRWVGEELYDVVKRLIDMVIGRLFRGKEIVIVSGNYSGADTLGETYAREKGYKVIRHYPKWDKYGQIALAVSTVNLVQEADFILYLWDGKKKHGMNFLLALAKEKRKPYLVFVVGRNGCVLHERFSIEV